MGRVPVMLVPALLMAGAAYPIYIGFRSQVHAGVAWLFHVSLESIQTSPYPSQPWLACPLVACHALGWSRRAEGEGRAAAEACTLPGALGTMV